MVRIENDIRNYDEEYCAAVVGLGVMGCIADGHDGKHPEWYSPCNHADAYQHHPAVRLVAGCSRSVAKREYFHNKYPESRTYGDFQELLESEKPDLISVATPATTHADIVIQSAQAGVKGIFCEKALACSLSECDEMIQACKENNTVLIVNHQRRFDNRFLVLKEQIEQGIIGKLQSVQISFGGGNLCRGGSHMFDLALMYIDDPVDQGWGFLSNPSDFDCGGMGVFQTVSGTRVVVDGSIGMKHYFQMDLIGERGTVRMLDGGFQTELWLLDEKSGFGLMNQHHLPTSYPNHSPMLHAVDIMIQSVNNSILPMSTGEDGRAAFEMISSIYASQANNRTPVIFPMKNRNIYIPSN